MSVVLQLRGGLKDGKCPIHVGFLWAKHYSGCTVGAKVMLLEWYHQACVLRTLFFPGRFAAFFPFSLYRPANPSEFIGAPQIFFLQ